MLCREGDSSDGWVVGECVGRKIFRLYPLILNQPILSPINIVSHSQRDIMQMHCYNSLCCL